MIDIEKKVKGGNQDHVGLKIGYKSVHYMAIIMLLYQCTLSILRMILRMYFVAAILAFSANRVYSCNT